MAEGALSITLDPASKRTLERLRYRWGQKSVADEMRRFFTKEAPRIAGQVSRSIRAGGRLRRRTGLLAKSIVGLALLVGTAPAIRIGIFDGPSLRYAGVQEYGTQGKDPSSPYPTIRPGRNISHATGRPTKALAVPTKLGLTAAGVGRNSPANWPEPLRFIRINRGKLVGMLVTEKSLKRAFRKSFKANVNFGIAGKRGLHEQDLKAVFLLLRMVDIAPKHYLRDGFKEALPEIGKRMAEHLVKYLGSAA